MRSRGLLTVGLTLALLGASRADANVAALTPAQRDQARTWVRQLAERSHKTREQAYQKLLDLGKPAIPVLEEGTKDSDLEVSRRCQRLLELARRTDTEA